MLQLNLKLYIFGTERITFRPLDLRLVLKLSQCIRLLSLRSSILRRQQFAGFLEAGFLHLRIDLGEFLQAFILLFHRPLGQRVCGSILGSKCGHLGIGVTSDPRFYLVVVVID